MTKPEKGSAYRAAGVDIDAQDRALDKIKQVVRSTYIPGVLSELGSFGGLFQPNLRGLAEPVLVASADGVGTKLRVAQMAGDFSTVGRDLVNHCVNDILVQGAEPLFFLDYVGAGSLEPEKVAALVGGAAAACRENGCALLGGETAEMPGFYQIGDYELVGFVVGMVDRQHVLDGSRVRHGDVLLGLPSSGLHTNGYSLARRILFDELGLGIRDPIPGLDPGRTVADWLLAVHRSYLPILRPILRHPGLHAMAHITGGGIKDNLPRVLPTGHRACIKGLPRPSGLWKALQEHGNLEIDEMLRVFNMGVGMVLVVSADTASEIVDALIAQGEEPLRLGYIEEGDRGVSFS